MEINVAKVTKIEGLKEHFELEDNSSQNVIRFYGEDYKILPPIKLEGSVVNYEGKLELEIDISASVEMTCSRCTEDFVQEISTSSNFTFVKDANESDKDYYLFKGDSIDITDLVMGEIAAELPMKPLCNTQCKGLCPSCGNNKNLTSCACRNDIIDSRLQILSKLLDEEQGGV